jgi:phosphoribosylanthranilate isomerase
MMAATRVKICGICRAGDAARAVELGASAIGFIFWPGSPRCIAPAQAREIAAQLPADVTAIGVFVDQPAEYVADVARLVALGAVQLHGSESIEAFAEIRQPLIKAVQVGDGFQSSTIDGLPASVTVLLDAHDPIRRGGTGRTIDWTLAAAVARQRPTILSGGLTAANVAEAIARVQPLMVDVSSGVESAPGRKDPDKLREFFAAVSSVVSHS